MNIVNVPDRYSETQKYVIQRFLIKLAQTTRKTGKITESAQAKIISSFEIYDPDVVIASLETYLNIDILQTKNGKGKNEKYVHGIMANKQAEKDGAGNGRSKILGRPSVKNGGAGKNKPESDEGERLRELAGTTAERQLDCDF